MHRRGFLSVVFGAIAAPFVVKEQEPDESDIFEGIWDWMPVDIDAGLMSAPQFYAAERTSGPGDGAYHPGVVRYLKSCTVISEGDMVQLVGDSAVAPVQLARNYGQV